MIALKTGGGGTREKASCVEARVAVEPESTAVIAVGPGFDRGNHEGATSAAELRGSYASLHTELVNGLGRREEDDRVDQGCVIVDAIENAMVILGPQPIHCQCNAPLSPE